MTPDRWKDVERLYHATRAEAPEARPAFLAKACGGDEALRKEVQSLHAHASASGVLDRAGMSVAAEWAQNWAHSDTRSRPVCL